MVDRTAPLPDSGERAARILRDLRSDINVRAGAKLGALTIGILWPATFVLGLVPIAILQVLLLGPIRNGTPFDYRWWAVWSLLGHFGSTAHLTFGANVSFLSLGGASVDTNLTGLLPLAILVGVMVLVGNLARPHLPDALGARFTVLVAASLTMAFVAAVVALFGGHTISSGTIAGNGLGSSTLSYSVSFDVLSALLRTFVVTLLIGAFTFRVVELLSVPQAAAVRSAVRFAVVPALVAALIAPLVIGVYGGRIAAATGTSGPIAGTALTAVSTLVSPAIGAAAIPMAFGTQATVGVSGANLGLLNKAEGEFGLPSIISGGDVTAALKSFSGGRIFRYAGYMGFVGKLGALALIVAILAYWWSSIGKYLTVMGAPSGSAGLARGAYLGLLAAVVVGVLALLFTVHVDMGASGLGQGAAVDLAVGITGLSYVYILLALVISGGVIGYVQAALHPSTERYTLSDVTRLVDRARMAVPEQYQAAARDLQSRTVARTLAVATTAAARRYCSHCGARFSDAATSFCEQCGAPRPLPAARPSVQMAGGTDTPTASQRIVSPPQASAVADYCTTCGTQHRDTASRFCRKCGASRQV